jgi:hypothetical protein
MQRNRELALKAAWDEVLRRADEDHLFRRRLLSDPRSVLEEAGIEIDSDCEICVVEHDPNRLHLILPPVGQFFDWDFPS